MIQAKSPKGEKIRLLIIKRKGFGIFFELQALMIKIGKKYILTNKDKTATMSRQYGERNA
jgi:hypothetical protein